MIHFTSHSRSLAASALLLLGAALSTAQAAIVSYTISGKLTSVVASNALAAEFPVGTAWSAVVSWDTAASNLFLSSTQGQYPVKGITLTLTGVSGTWTTSTVTNGGSFTLNYEGSADAIQFTSGWGPTAHTNATIADLQPYSVNLTLTDPTGTAIAALNAPPSSLTFSQWSPAVANSYLKFYLNNDGDRFLVGDIRSITTTGAGGSSSTPTSQAVTAGASATLTTAAAGTIQWQRNGTNLAGATTGTLSLNNVQPASAGIYSALVASGGTTTMQSAILGVSSSVKIIGTGAEVDGNIRHPNGKHYDQVLLSGAAATITADATQATRTSFIDLDGDIVQVEFSGAGTLSIVLDAPTGPAAPTKYNQPTVSYMKGHAGLVITGADETTNVTVFTVGRATAFDPTGAYDITKPAGGSNNPANNGSGLFVGHTATTYDGFADLAFVAIQSANGKFGGVRTANASYFAAKGYTGIYAPGVEFTGPVFVHDINASDTATPVMLLGSAGDARVTGGTLKQDNSRAVQIKGVTQLKFTDGASSHGTLFTAQANQAVLESDGVNVTTQVAVNPTPAGGGSTVTKQLTYFAAGANPPFANGAKKSFEVSLTSLKFDTTTLTNPTALTLTAPLTGAKFTDTATSLVWEVYFRNGAFHEINVMRNGAFVGQWSE